jgi:excisionase family DNA binding protein
MSTTVIEHSGKTRALEGGFVTVPEAAQLLRLSRAKVYSLMDAGDLAYAKFGKARRIPREALETYVRQCMVGGGRGAHSGEPRKKPAGTCAGRREWDGRQNSS